MRKGLIPAVLVAVWFLSGCAYYHVVEPGDTLYELSKDYGVSVQEIEQANPGIDAYNLQIGQQVKIPRFSNQHVADYSQANPRHAQPADKPAPRASVGSDNHQPGTSAKNPPPKDATTDDNERTAPPPKAGGKQPPKQPPEPAKTAPAAGAAAVKVETNAPQFIWPVQGGRVVSRYGDSTAGVMAHGIEIEAPEGTPVVAAADGKVALATDRFKGYGNMVVILHDNNMFSIYSFNKQNLVEKGQQVKQGQKVAEVGQTGPATRPMLHFQMRIGSQTVDPLKYLPQ